MRNLSQETKALKAELESLLDDIQFCEEMLSKGKNETARKMLDIVYRSMKDTVTTQELRQSAQGGRNE